MQNDHINKLNRKSYHKNLKKNRIRKNEYWKNLPSNIKSERIKRSRFYQEKRYVLNKAYLFEQKLFKCRRCGYDEFSCGIDGHHLQPNQKKNKYDILSRWMRKLSLKSFAKKIKETDLLFLCKNCHTALENEEWKVEDILR